MGDRCLAIPLGDSVIEAEVRARSPTARYSVGVASESVVGLSTILARDNAKSTDFSRRKPA
jgi:hypothetical protein